MFVRWEELVRKQRTRLDRCLQEWSLILGSSNSEPETGVGAWRRGRRQQQDLRLWGLWEAEKLVELVRFAFLKDHTGCSMGNGLEKEAGRPFRSLYQYSRLETMTPHLLYSKCPEPAASATRRSFPETQTPVSTPPGPLNQILHYNYISKSG